MQLQDLQTKPFYNNDAHVQTHLTVPGERLIKESTALIMKDGNLPPPLGE